MYLGECQDSSSFDENRVEGNLLICSYSIGFVLGLSTIKQALDTAKNLSAAGVVIYLDPLVIGFQLNAIPMKMLGIVIPTANDSKVKVPLPPLPSFPSFPMPPFRFPPIPFLTPPPA